MKAGNRSHKDSEKQRTRRLRIRRLIKKGVKLIILF